MSNLIRINLYVDAALKRELERLARLDNRSLSGYLQTLCVKHVEALKDSRTGG